MSETDPLNGLIPEDSPAMRLTAFGGLAAIVAGVAAVAYLDPVKNNILPACPLLTATGYACPGCGLTRGFHALFHGDVITALDFNLLIPIWALMGTYISTSLILFTIRGRGLPAFYLNNYFLFSLLGALLVFGVLRNIPAWPLTILYP